MRQNDPSNVAQVIVVARAEASTKESRDKMSSEEREGERSPSSERLSEKQDHGGEHQAGQEAARQTSSPEPASDDDPLDSPRTVRSASPIASARIDCQVGAPPLDRPVAELSARELLNRQDGSSAAAAAEPRDALLEVDLGVADTSSQPQRESISVQPQPQQQQQEQDRAPTISSMYARSSPSTSFRYCYTERAHGGINYHSNERAGEDEEERAARSNQRPGANGDMMRAFSEAQPKLSFASKRMKEYFESLKGRAGEAGRSPAGSRSHRLYQFFKSTRTELVGCLLFSVIVCQTLISCRVHQWAPSGELEAGSEPANNLLSPQLPNQLTHSVSSEADARAQVAVEPQLKQQQQPFSHHQNSAQLHVRLVVALVAAFGAATLTQVFGHISGCHLVPAVSLALYFKGHISRARLASYLGAQSAGALAGVALLGLLTSSQTSSLADHQLALSETLASLRPPIEAARAGAGDQQIIPSTANRLMRHRREAVALAAATRPEASPQPAATSRRPSLSLTQTMLTRQKRDQSKRFASASGGDKVIRPARRRRQAAAGDGAHQPKASANDTTHVAHANGLISGSEAILLSIMEQKERELGARQQQFKVGAGAQGEAAPSSPAPATTFGARQQAGVLFNRISKSDTAAELEAGHHDKAQSGGSEVLAGSPSANGAAPSSPGPLEPRGNAPEKDNWTHESARNATVVAGRLVMVPLVTSPNVSDHASGPPADSATPASSHAAGLLEIELPPTRAEEGPRKEQPGGRRLRLKKRTRRQQQQQNINSTMEQRSASRASVAPEEWPTRSVSHSNLLEFALPASVMSSDSMRACIKKQYAKLASSGAMPSLGQRLDQSEPTLGEERAARRLELLNCSGLSNGSQMFIFQLLATLLVVLTYLVNVDPRRVDVGFKSLSIGLAYFLAHLLTFTSGGFYGNPSELLALVWLSSAPASESWHIEWLAYLVVPLVGGLFGALSHEYIDFTSLRNRNKKLHLRRSFFSLESLADASHDRRPLAHTRPAHESANSAGTQARPTTTRRANGAPAHLSASVSIGSSADGAGGSSSSSRGGSQTSVMMLNETVSEAGSPLERPAPRQPRRESLDSSSRRQTRSHQHRAVGAAAASSPKSSRLSLGSRQTVAPDLLLDSNFLICCANNGQQQGESRLSSGQTSLASSLGCQRAANGRRKLAAPAPLCSVLGARGAAELSGAQFVCTSQFM